MNRSLLHRIAASVAIILMIGGPIFDASGQRRGGGGGAAVGEGFAEHFRGSVRQTRNTQRLDEPRPATPETQRTETAQGTRQTTRTQGDQPTRQSANQARDVETDQVGEATVIQGEQGGRGGRAGRSRWASRGLPWRMTGRSIAANGMTMASSTATTRTSTCTMTRRPGRWPASPPAS